MSNNTYSLQVPFLAFFFLESFVFGILIFLSFFDFFVDKLPMSFHHVILSLIAIPVVPLGLSLVDISAFFRLRASGSLNI